KLRRADDRERGVRAPLFLFRPYTPTSSQVFRTPSTRRTRVSRLSAVEILLSGWATPFIWPALTSASTITLPCARPPALEIASTAKSASFGLDDFVTAVVASFAVALGLA